MPFTPSVYHPDPNKWIDTGKSTKKPPTQRPLTAIRHGLYTPPPSSIRRAKAATRDDSPIVKQLGLSGYMTPPTTGPAIRPKYDRLQKGIAEELKDTPTNVKAKVVEKKLDDFWGSSDSEPGPSTRRKENVHDVVDLTSDDRDELQPSIHAGPPKSRKSRDTSPSINPSTILPLASQPIPSSHLAASASRSPPHPTPFHDDLPHETTSPPCPITPVPHSVLAEHRRLCGQGTDQQERIRTSWRGPDAHPSPSRNMTKKSPSKQITSRVKAIAKDKENKRVKRGLVQLSDQESEGRPEKRRKASQPAGEALQSLKVNAGSREFVHGFVSPKKRPRRASIDQFSSLERPQSIFEPFAHDGAVYAPPPITQELRPASPRSHSPSPRSSPVPTSPLTPRKNRGYTVKHNITPPKSRSPRKITDHRETLFAFPSPAQPRFAHLSASPPARGWEPMEWDHAETLMVWGPETMRQTLARRPVASEQPEDVGGNVGRPEPSPVQHSRMRRTGSDASESESLAPSIPSQSFPNLVRSSPQKRNSTLLRFEAPPVEEDPVEMPCKQPQSRKSTSPRRSLSPAAHQTPLAGSAARRVSPEDRWRALDMGILSVPVRASTSDQKTPTQSSQSRKRKLDSASHGQTKLAAFGFFPDPPPLRARPSHAAFENEWEAEEHLEEAENEELLSSPRAASPQDSGRPLSRVPEAPFHPDLRPAGVAELHRRQDRATAAKSSSPLTDLTLSSPTPAYNSTIPARPTTTGHRSSSDDSSSLTSEDPLFPESREQIDRAREWFEEIGNRRSSEFGSFRST